MKVPPWSPWANTQGCCRASSAQIGAAAQPLGQRHSLRCYAEVLTTKQSAQATDAGLDFVRDQQQPVVIARGAQALQKGRRGRVHAALALHRLEHDGHSVVADQGLHRSEVVEPCLWKACHLRRKHAVPARLARFGHRGQRAAVESIAKGDDFVGPAFVQLPPSARQSVGPLLASAPLLVKTNWSNTLCWHSRSARAIAGALWKAGVGVSSKPDCRASASRLQHGRACSPPSTARSPDSAGRGRPTTSCPRREGTTGLGGR